MRMFSHIPRRGKKRHPKVKVAKTNYPRYSGSQESLDTIILYFSRLVLGVQLVLAGVQLPSRYLKTQWRPLSILLGPIMVAMWLATSLLVWALVPNLPFLHALAIGSCVTPTVSTRNLFRSSYYVKEGFTSGSGMR